MEQQLALNACQAGRCAEVVDRGVLFCDRHFAMLHEHTRRELLDAWRPGKPPSKRFLVALELARVEISYADQFGHPPPEQGVFPW